MKNLKKGFTLIELLIVITILGVLAVVVIVALNPLEQLAKTRDSGRLSTVSQLGHDLEAYAINNNSTYVTPNATWIATLVTAGEIGVIPSSVAYGTNAASCTTNVQNTYCYNSGAAGAAPMIVYARLEAKANTSRCAAATPQAYAVYSSADGRAGIVCRAAGAEPVTGAQTFLP